MKWIKRFLLLIFSPVALLLLIEFTLRLFDIGSSSNLFVPFKDGARNLVVTNPDFTAKYFGSRLVRTPWPAAFEMPKPSEEFRLFILGESAALGDPIPEYGMARILEALLQAEMPDRRIRVINAAITAVNSHVIREIAGEIARLEPDAVFIYMGNNEVVGPFGPGTVFTMVARSPVFVDVFTAIRGSRTGQLAEALLVRFGSRPESWAGMEMFLEQKVEADNPQLKQMRVLFAANLSRVIAVLRALDVPVVASSVAVNLQDCAPLGSNDAGHRSVKAFRDAQKAAEQGDFLTAHTLYSEALEFDPLRFRADRAINQIIRSTAEQSGATFMDGASIIATASTNGIPGENLFYDHVHLNFEGQFLLAKAFASALLERDIATTQDTVAKQIGWSAFSARAALNEMFSRRLRPPFAGQIDKEEVESRWIERLIETELLYRSGLFGDEGGIINRAIDFRGDRDAELWQMRARLYEESGKFEQASEAFARAVGLWPHHAELKLDAAASLAAAGSDDRAFNLVRREDRWRRWGDDEIWSNLGQRLLERGQPVHARNLFYRSWLINPENQVAAVNLAASRASEGNQNEAIVVLRNALKRDPKNELGWANLGGALFEQGKIEDAIIALQKALDLNPENGLTHEAMAVALEAAGDASIARRHYLFALQARPLDAVLLGKAIAFAGRQKEYDWASALAQRLTRLHAADAGVWYTWGLYEGLAGRYDRGIGAIEQALILKPRDPYYLHALGQYWLQTDQPTNALAHLEEAIQLRPEQIGWQYNLIWILAVHPDNKLRNPDAALNLLRQLNTNDTSREIFLDLQAAATASAGKFSEAFELLSGIQLEKIIDTKLREQMIKRRELYRQGKSYIPPLSEFAPELVQ